MTDPLMAGLSWTSISTPHRSGIRGTGGHWAVGPCSSRWPAVPSCHHDDSVSELEECTQRNTNDESDWEIQAVTELCQTIQEESELNYSGDGTLEEELLMLRQIEISFSDIDPIKRDVGCDWNEKDACAVDRNGDPKYCWVDDATEVFGYPSTEYSDFILHHQVEHGWTPLSIGDLYQYSVVMCLNQDAPYPGDELRWGATSSHCFALFRLDEDTFTIIDSNSDQEELTIPASLLKNPRFWISSWYAKQRATALALPHNSAEKQRASRKMGDTVCTGLHFIISHGTSLYPGMSELRFREKLHPYDRFEVFRNERIGKETAMITVVDHASLVVLKIDEVWLENPYFNAIRWLAKQLKAYAMLLYAKTLQQELKLNKMRRRELQESRSEQWRQHRMGNVLVVALESQLNANQPYPGDSMDPEMGMRFIVWEDKLKNQFSWIDHEQGLGGEVPTDWVIDPQFSVAEFWSYQLAAFGNTAAFQDMDYPVMGHPLATAARKILTKHIPFITGNKELDEDIQYIVYLSSDGQGKEYIIKDVQHEFKTAVAVRSLMNPNFDLPCWYQTRLMQAHDALLCRLQGPVEYEFLPRFMNGFSPTSGFEQQQTAISI
ncbi:hypothetical protein IW261DRAFT_1427137 [Armillaria novae-zelandiae]|uniref:Uncharacterized protein n=1 Tax=Armillaria novae-zelandiae TaxID=153914 RepID=A0AA39T5C8_9AGAR|nr:hypothetical protein IW261DRAFT_1427137 [Armillaria novae-zelandiae]